MLKDDPELVETIRKAALLNAVQHGSAAQPGPIIGKILGEKQELRTRAKELTDLINQVLNEVNSLSAEDRRKTVEEKYDWKKISEDMVNELEKKLTKYGNHIKQKDRKN